MTRTRRPFASVVQVVLIVLMVLSFVLIAQRFTFVLYKAGLLLLIACALVQIGFGNIPPTATFGRSMKYLGIALAMVAGLFAVGRYLAPFLIQLGRG
jgi:hypothetical protein